METTIVTSTSKRRFAKVKRWDSFITGHLFISPWLIGFLLLTLYPMIQSLYYSFTDFSLLEEANWVGVRITRKYSQ